MRLGLLARAEIGSGLAYQTLGYHRWLEPARTIVVDMDTRGRSPLQPWYPDAEIVAQRDLPAAWPRFLDGLDAVLTAETPYDFSLYDEARERGVRTVCQVNPELFDYHQFPRRPWPDLVVSATPWRLDTLGRGHLLPFPVDRSEFPPRDVDSVRTLVHVAAPAMLDRNGTQLVTAALRFVTQPCRFIVYGAEVSTRVRAPHFVRVETRPMAPTRQEMLAEADALVLPRRYGGLSLVMQESASAGLPIISLDVEPQRDWLLPDTLVPIARRNPRVNMKGGPVTVHDADPRALARAIDRLVAEPDLAQRASKQSDAWAESISWERWLPTWRAALAGEWP